LPPLLYIIDINKYNFKTNIKTKIELKSYKLIQYNNIGLSIV